MAPCGKKLRPSLSPNNFPLSLMLLTITTTHQPASSDTGHFMFFDPAKCELIASVRGHLNAVFCVAFSPDGKRLITSSGGREAIKIWSVDTQQELITLPGAGSFLWSASWSQDGNEILASQPTQIWHAPSWEEIAAVEMMEKAKTKQP